MTSPRHDLRFPGETDEYRTHRNELLEAEIALRTRLEAVAALRRELPEGGLLKKNYTFGEMVGGEVRETRFSELFAPGKSSLVVYSYMYGGDMKSPCPMCTSLLDGLDGEAPHARQRINLAVVAKASPQELAAVAKDRGWQELRMLSSQDNSYNRDYFGENEKGQQLPMLNVFTRGEDGEIHHFYGTELLYTPLEGQPRHVDLLWPLWNLFDLTPEGRGTDWYPKLSYD